MVLATLEALFIGTSVGISVGTAVGVAVGVAIGVKGVAVTRTGRRAGGGGTVGDRVGSRGLGVAVTMIGRVGLGVAVTISRENAGSSKVRIGALSGTTMIGDGASAACNCGLEEDAGIGLLVGKGAWVRCEG